MKSSAQTIAIPFAVPSQPLYRWLLAIFMLTVIAVGWKYPLLGFAVPIAMLTGMAGGLFRGRYACGNICPMAVFMTRSSVIWGAVGRFRRCCNPPLSAGALWRF